MGAIAIEWFFREEVASHAHFGSLQDRAHVSALRIERCAGTDGGLCFAASEPIVVDKVRREFRYMRSSQPERSQYLRGLRVEVRSDRGKIVKGEHLALCEHPYPKGWTARPLFKPGNQKPKQPPVLQSGDDPYAWIEERPHDFWETDSTRLVAGSFLQENSMPPGEPRNELARGMMLFGVCADAEACIALLESDEKVQRLLDLTESGRLRLGHPDAQHHSGGDLRPYPAVRERAFEVMHLSLRQALAGPPKDDAKWIGRPVVDLVDDIFCAHMNNLNKQEWRSREPLEKRRRPESDR